MGGNYLLYPQDGKVRLTSPFGMRNGSQHTGVDLASDNIGTDWNLAAADGVVTNVGYSKSDIGYWVEIKLDFKINGKVAYIRYYHNKESVRFYDRKGSPLIKIGNRVTQGEKIGTEGSTGKSSGSHLHFELRLGSNLRANAVDPIPYLRVPKNLPVDGGLLTRTQFKNIQYVEDIKTNKGDEDLNLKKGDKGTMVKAVQTAIIGLGYSLSIYGADGSFGTMTEEVVKRVQKDGKLKVDGIVGPDTLSYIITRLSENPKLTKAKDLAKQISSL